jgi:3-oxo-5-alpha-steroid 4-dehydrogenase 1
MSAASALLSSALASLRGITHAQACWAFAASGAATFPVLFFVSAPYGKLHRAGWGPAVDGRLGWFLQEVLSPVALLHAFAHARGAGAWGAFTPAHAFLALWCAHYANRAVLYPLQRRMGATTLPVVAAAVAFNLVNGALVGAELGSDAAAARFADWDALLAPRTLAGLLLFALGAAVNIRADAALRALRSAGGADRSYRIPRGGLFELVACPHYLGEILEWLGFALATRTLAAAVFAFWTAANLAPRAHATRDWYRDKFREEYPRSRRALVPFLF